MQIHENFSLKPYNTFAINAKARYFSSFSTIDELEELMGSKISKNSSGKSALLVLGGGSNILFIKDFDGLVLKNEMKGIDELHEDKEYVYVKAGAGVNWHQFVLYCIERNWGGIENLSLIPGNVGAAPIQNIGAYGVEMETVFHSLEAFHLLENRIYNFTKHDCEFGYRDSVFKRKYKDRFAILSVTFKLAKHPVFHTSYGAVKQELEKMNIHQLTIQAISQAVINIRSSKLPDPAQIPNAGSFFKNPEVSTAKYNELKAKFDTIIAYPLVNDKVKLAAGWMIEQCGWKGKRKGDAGCHERQALVLVNYGNATGRQVYDLAEEILLSVKEKFGVELEKEVNII